MPLLLNADGEAEVEEQLSDEVIVDATTGTEADDESTRSEGYIIDSWDKAKPAFTLLTAREALQIPLQFF